MGSIYGNRDRKDNNRVEQQINQNRRANNYNNRARNFDGADRRNKRKDYKNNSKGMSLTLDNILQNVKVKRFINSALVNLIITAIIIVFSVLLISSSHRDVYIKLLMLPLASFIGGFVMKFLNKDAILNIAGTIAVQFIAFLIFVDFSFFVFLWLLFYIVNAIVGTLLATVAKNYNKY